MACEGGLCGDRLIARGPCETDEFNVPCLLSDNLMRARWLPPQRLEHSFETLSVVVVLAGLMCEV
jgi:hypothetical protein